MATLAKLLYHCRVQINSIAIMKCDLFFHCCDAKEISLYCFCNTKLCAKHKKNTCKFHLYCWNLVDKVNDWNLVDCLHCKFRVSA